jgi:hypothetical protein
VIILYFIRMKAGEAFAYSMKAQAEDLVGHHISGSSSSTEAAFLGATQR